MNISSGCEKYMDDVDVETENRTVVRGEDLQQHVDAVDIGHTLALPTQIQCVDLCVWRIQYSYSSPLNLRYFMRI